MNEFPSDQVLPANAFRKFDLRGLFLFKPYGFRQQKEEIAVEMKNKNNLLAVWARQFTKIGRIFDPRNGIALAKYEFKELSNVTLMSGWISPL